MAPDVDTVTAVASGWARSERAIVRLSGPGVRELVEGLFEGASFEPHAVQRARFMLVESPRRLTLPCVLMTFVGPRSYTGEDAAEMLVPGSPVLLERVISRLTSWPGVREAGPGEFSARAYLNEKLTLVQAEGVAALIGAQSEAELAAAQALVEGTAGERYRKWADETATLLALVEAGIDFTDQEDVVAIEPATLAARLEALIGQVRARLEAAGGVERRVALPRVVLAGAPNAGKSTLFNALLGRRRTVTSEAAGTTRDVIEERLDLCGEAPGGGEVMLVDLAGVDEALSAEQAPEVLTQGRTGEKEPDTEEQSLATDQRWASRGEPGRIEAEAQRRAREAIEAADVLVYCDPDGRYALALGRGTPVIRVRTKADLPRDGSARGGDGKGDGAGGGEGAVAVCALDGWNLSVLRRAIADAAWGAGRGGGGTAFLLPRHRRALADALDRLREALELARAEAGRGASRTPELVAGALRSALDSLGELTGRVTPDDVIGRVFATFCVGK